MGDAGRTTRAYSPLRRALGVAGLALLVAAELVAAHRLAPKHWGVVEAGALYRSGWIPPGKLADVVTRHGIRTVVNLRSRLENESGDWHAREAEVLRRAGVRLVDLPMHTGHPPDPETLAAWLDLIRDPASAPILVHCQYGVIRTGMMVAVYDIERRGRDGAGAWAAFEWFGHEPDADVLERMSAFVTGYDARSIAAAP